MFFDLSKLKDTNPATRTMDFYLEKGVGTLQLNYPMIIFCDSTTKPLIKELRDRLVDHRITPTIYIERNISEYDFYIHNLDIIKNNRLTVQNYQSADQRNTPSYCITTMFKLLALQIANLRDDFNASHYAWIDFGCSHVIERFKASNIPTGQDMRQSCTKMLDNPRDKVSILYIHYRGSEEMRNMNHFINSGPCCMAATAFTVQKEYVSKFYNAALSIFHEQLLNGCCHSEEGVMAYCFDRYPELFNIYYGDYYSVTKNYHYITQDYDCIKYHFIFNCLKKNRIDLAKDAALKVLDSVNQGILNLNKEDLIFLNQIKNL